MKKRYRILSLLLAAVMLLSACGSKEPSQNTAAGGQFANSEDVAGDNSSPDTPAKVEDIHCVVNPAFQLTDGFIIPIERIETPAGNQIGIYSASDFRKIEANPNGNYVLMSDIDLAGDWNSISEFSGVLDGNGYTVSNANGWIIGGLSGTVKNLGMHDDSGTGPIVGDMYEGSRIDNCFRTGEVDVEGHCVGGIVGIMYEGCTIINCYNAADIGVLWSNWEAAFGGICGETRGRDGNEIRIVNCFNAGYIDTLDYTVYENPDFGNMIKRPLDKGTGGIVGRVYSGNVKITSCYNDGQIVAWASYINDKVKGPDYAPVIASGIVGLCGNNNSSTMISLCYNSAPIQGEMECGITASHGFGEVQVIDCYNDGWFSPAGYSYGIGASQGNAPVPMDGGISGPYGDEMIQIIGCYNGNPFGGETGAITNRSPELYGCAFLRLDDDDRGAAGNGALYSAENVIAMTEEQMADFESYIPGFFDTENIWQMGYGDYPFPVFRITDVQEDGYCYSTGTIPDPV